MENDVLISLWHFYIQVYYTLIIIICVAGPYLNA